ncbi:tyrosine-type recombinase/integrase [Brevibacillus halotolerans]|nr:tyrosine-type recombinase/integrase [Brevibacillus halotolerans]
MKGHFRKRGSKWSFGVALGTDPNTGKRRQITRSGFKTKKEAEAACAQLISEFENEQYIKESKETYGEYLLDYMENTARHTIRPSTFDFHLFIAKKHIIPEIGSLKIKDLTPRHLQKLYSKKLKAGLASSYIRNMHAVISKSLKTATEWGLVRENIASLTTPPRIEKRQVQTWSLEQANHFLDTIKFRKTGNRKFHIVYVLAIYCGMRKGEILGLRWQDCDLEQGYIRIQQTIVKADGRLTFQAPKTRNSVRTIDVPEFAIQSLKTHQLMQKEKRLSLGSAYNDHDLVVANWNGTPVLPSDLNKDFKVACQFAKVPAIRFHDLRHTHATLLLQLGENPKVVSERLGHADVNITLNTYAHVLPTMQKSLAKNFDNAMKQSQKTSL